MVMGLVLFLCAGWYVSAGAGWSGATHTEARRGQGEIVILPDLLAWSPALSVTLMVNVNLPAAVGVPSRLLPVSVTPGGSWPAATAQVNGPVPPEEKKFWR